LDFANRKVITLAEWSTMKEMFEEEEKEDDCEDELEETQEEVVEEANEVEMLVLRRVLTNQKRAKDKQKKNIFHSRCMVQGKVCLVVINGGSCANVVSLRMIEKLGLQTITRPVMPRPLSVAGLTNNGLKDYRLAPQAFSSCFVLAHKQPRQLPSRSPILKLLPNKHA